MLFSQAPRTPEKLRFTGTPPGGKVEINGVAVATAPFGKDYPGGYFHKTKTAVGSRLGHRSLYARHRWQKQLTVLAGSSQTFHVEFPSAQENTGGSAVRRAASIIQTL